MLTTEQLNTVKTAVLADQTAKTYLTSGDDIALANWLNAPTTFVVWRTLLTPQMSQEAIVSAATQLDSLTIGKRDALFWLCERELNPSNPNVRAAFDDLCGTQTALKTAIQAVEKRNATKLESLLATGLGTSASPGTLTYEGDIFYGDASLLRN